LGKQESGCGSCFLATAAMKVGYGNGNEIWLQQQLNERIAGICCKDTHIFA
jgi:hypothetical protein